MNEKGVVKIDREAVIQKGDQRIDHYWLIMTKLLL